jgi:hypothetical protein
MTLARLNREMSGHRGQPQSLLRDLWRCLPHTASFPDGTHHVHLQPFYPSTQFPSFVTSVTSVRCSLHFASFSHGTHRGLLSVIENCIAGE